jgi:hypothetical protein
VTGVGQSLVSQSTLTRSDDFMTSCGQGTGSDLVLDYMAPSAGWYQFDTVGSDFDTALALFQSCNGSELACNDDTGGATTSRVVRELSAQERLIAVIDGKFGQAGQAVFNAELVTCPAADLSGQSFPISQTTAGGPSEHDGVCGGAGEPERSFRWTPSQSGLYRFSVTSDEIVPALYVEDGPLCGGTLLGCSQALSSSPVTADDRYPARVVRYLEANQSVTIIVDSKSGVGQFSLDIEAVGGSCPDATGVLTKDSDIYGTLTRSSDLDLLSTSCRQPVAITLGGTPVERPEDRYLYTHIPVQTETCQLWVGLDASALDQGAVTLLEGQSCAGPEVFEACGVTDGVDPEWWIYSFDAQNAGDYLLLIEGGGNALEMDYEIHFLCAQF